MDRGVGFGSRSRTKGPESQTLSWPCATVTRPAPASAWGWAGRGVWSTISTSLPRWERERVLPLPSGSDFRSSSVFEVVESSRVGEARRAAMALARELGLSQTETAEVGIVVTEAATNLVKHARGGVLLIR